ncbi:MAG: peptidyl-prolyl cis-trans isomerase [Chromatiales bacterium]|nr:peptidyl-prolyl cis-trans isomerase [Chromatiales bacterium]
MSRFALVFALVLAGALPAAAQAVQVELKTSLGPVVLELDTEKAPKTVENFLAYVRDGHYDGTVFHRVIPGFMAQGGGFDKDLNQKSTRATIENESGNGLTNSRGTIAMARTNAPHSATAQFFINLIDNDFLNKKGSRWGYAVFGKVVAGMEVVDEMAAIPTGARGPFRQDVPKTDIVIESARILETAVAQEPTTGTQEAPK